MSTTELLRLVVDADTKGAVSGIEKLGSTAKKELDSSQQRLDKWGSGLTKVGSGMVALGATALVGLGGMAMASEDAHLATVKLQNTLENMPKLAGENSKQFIDLANAIQKKTAADGDQIVAAEAMLGTFSLTAGQIKAITPLVVDYSRRFGVDMVDAATQVGKALDGQVGALKRNGVSIDEAMFKTDRYGAVQKALSQQVGGFAEEEGKTFAGSLERMRNELGDLAEGVGSGAVDAFTTLFGVVDKVASAMESVSPGTQETAGQIATFGAVALIAAGGASTLIGQAIKMRENFTAAAAAVKGLSFANVATGLAVVAPLAIGAALALDQYNKTKATAAKLTDLYVDALKQEAGATKAATDATTSKQLLDSSFGASLRKNGADLEVFNKAIRDQGDDLEKLNRAADFFTDLGFDKAMETAGVKSSDLTRELDRLSKSLTPGEMDQLLHDLDQLSDNYDRATEKTKNQAFAENELKDQHGAGAAAAGDMAGALDNEATAADNATSAIQRQNDELRAGLDPLFGAVTANQRLADANAAVTSAGMEAAAAVKEHGASSLEALAAQQKLADAEDAAAQAALGQQSAILTLSDAVDNGSVSINGAKATLQQWVNMGLITQATAEATAAKFDGLSSAVAATPGGKSITVTETGSSAAAFRLAEMKSRLDALPSHVSTVVDITATLSKTAALLGFGGGRASGGPVAGGTVYEVAEGGPEMLTSGGRSYLLPAGAGYVTPLQPAGGGRGGGGSSMVIHIGQVVANDPVTLIEQIKRYERTNGSGWRN